MHIVYRCHSCSSLSKALNNLCSSVPNAYVGEGMSKKLRPALTQMFAYLYLAHVLNIFSCVLGGITNKALVTHFFHEKKFIFSQKFFGGNLYIVTNSATGCLRDEMELDHLSCSTPLQQQSSGLFWTSLTHCLVLTVMLNSFSINPWCQIFMFGHTWLMGCRRSWQCTASCRWASLFFLVWYFRAFGCYLIHFLNGSANSSSLPTIVKLDFFLAGWKVFPDFLATSVGRQANADSVSAVDLLCLVMLKRSEIRISDWCL